MRRVAVGVWLGVAALVAMGCGRSHAASPPPPDPSTPAGWLEAYALLECERGIRCASPPEFNAYYDASGVDCRFLYSSTIDIRARRQAALREGRLEVDLEAGRRCLEEMTDRCLPFGNRRSCREAFVGLVPVGGSCQDDFECAPAAHCERGPEPCTGSCEPDAVPGEDCRERECAPGSFCDLDRGCVAVREVEVDEGDACVSGRRAAGVGETLPLCGPDLYCVDTCARFPSRGEPCDPEGWPICAPGWVCAEGEAGDFRCSEFIVLEEPGAACGPRRLCNGRSRLVCEEGRCQRVECFFSFHCQEDELCTSTNTCVHSTARDCSE